MTGYAVVEQAMLLLNYTTPTGDTDNNLNAEQIRRSLPALNAVLMDIMRIQGKTAPPIGTLAEELPLSDEAALLVAAPGVAMYIAHGENDADNYNRFSLEYAQRRNGLKRSPGRIRDTVPTPEW